MAALSLSVVIPTCDTRELTLRCLDSLASGSAALEVIVVDDASADGTAEAIARRHPEVRLLVNSQRAGDRGGRATIGAWTPSGGFRSASLQASCC